jgi:hydrogenase maturation protease
MNEVHAAAVLIVGIGNDILTDDGIGPRLVRDLDDIRFTPEVAFAEATLGGMELLDLVKDYHEVIFIDALKTGMTAPGTVRQFVPEDFEETLHLSNIHDLDFLTALELGRRTGMQVPASVSIIAIEIVEDRVFSREFSPEIQAAYPEILKTVRELLCKKLASLGYMLVDRA